MKESFQNISSNIKKEYSFRIFIPKTIIIIIRYVFECWSDKKNNRQSVEGTSY